ncbi:MAG: hypothetical protein IKJ07_04265 [Clostridia bacterium]|nr:hypothetical protein [Clostridia bacterium]
MTAVLTEIIELLTSGITGMATGIGGGLANLVKSIFLEVSESGAVEGLSIFGGVIVVFAGVALAIGLSKLVVHWVTSLGSSRGM